MELKHYFVIILAGLLALFTVPQSPFPSMLTGASDTPLSIGPSMELMLWTYDWAHTGSTQTCNWEVFAVDNSTIFNVEMKAQDGAGNWLIGSVTNYTQANRNSSEWTQWSSNSFTMPSTNVTCYLKVTTQNYLPGGGAGSQVINITNASFVSIGSSYPGCEGKGDCVISSIYTVPNNATYKHKNFNIIAPITLLGNATFLATEEFKLSGAGAISASLNPPPTLNITALRFNNTGTIQLTGPTIGYNTCYETACYSCTCPANYALPGVNGGNLVFKGADFINTGIISLKGSTGSSGSTLAGVGCSIYFTCAGPGFTGGSGGILSFTNLDSTFTNTGTINIEGGIGGAGGIAHTGGSGYSYSAGGPGGLGGVFNTTIKNLSNIGIISLSGGQGGNPTKNTYANGDGGRAGNISMKIYKSIYVTESISSMGGIPGVGGTGGSTGVSSQPQIQYNTSINGHLWSKFTPLSNNTTIATPIFPSVTLQAPNITSSFRTLDGNITLLYTYTNMSNTSRVCPQEFVNIGISCYLPQFNNINQSLVNGTTNMTGNEIDGNWDTYESHYDSTNNYPTNISSIYYVNYTNIRNITGNNNITANWIFKARGLTYENYYGGVVYYNNGTFNTPIPDSCLRTSIIQIGLKYTANFIAAPYGGNWVVNASAQFYCINSSSQKEYFYNSQFATAVYYLNYWGYDFYEEKINWNVNGTVYPNYDTWITQNNGSTWSRMNLPENNFTGYPPYIYNITNINNFSIRSDHLINSTQNKIRIRVYDDNTQLYSDFVESPLFNTTWIPTNITKNVVPNGTFAGNTISITCNFTNTTTGATIQNPTAIALIDNVPFIMTYNASGKTWYLSYSNNSWSGGNHTVACSMSRLGYIGYYNLSEIISLTGFAVYYAGGASKLTMACPFPTYPSSPTIMGMQPSYQTATKGGIRVQQFNISGLKNYSIMLQNNPPGPAESYRVFIRSDRLRPTNPSQDSGWIEINAVTATPILYNINSTNLTAYIWLQNTCQNAPTGSWEDFGIVFFEQG